MAYDVLIRGGTLVDGSGNPWRYADVAVSGKRITAVAPPGRIDPANAAEVVDAAGHVVCPGFIDIQSHSIVPLMRDARCLSKIAQGVTTEIMGEAWTPAPAGGQFPDPMNGRASFPGGDEWRERARGWRRFGDWLGAYVERGVSPNVGSFLGGGTLRQYGRGMEMGTSSPEQIATMQRVMAEAMEDGAFGVSYALIYPPDSYADTDEIVAICEVVARMGGVYITHLRSEADTFLDGLEEALEIGRRSGAPVEVYHLKAAGKRNWHKMPEAIARIDAARADGIDVTSDMYPYVIAGTGLTSLLPPWAAEGGRLYERLRDPAERARLRAAALAPDGTWEALGDLAGPEGVIPVHFQRPEHQRYAGRTLADIAAERGQHWLDAAMDLLAAEGQRISTIYVMMDEENLRLQLRQPWIKISSDAGGLDPAWAAPQGPTHPRAYGTWPRVLGTYVRDERVITLEDAIRKMTSSVAERLDIRDRGLVHEGFAADLVIFDPAIVADRATIEQPHQLPVGIRDVWVNGTRVLRDGSHTGATPGKVVRPGS